MRNSTFLLAVIFLAACAAQPTGTPQPVLMTASDESRAFHALATFFTLLREKNYAAAIPLYGGDYENLQGWNPDLNPSDYAALWQRACEQNGLQCLEVRKAELLHREDDTYVFQVEFNNPDGSLFVLGPCCGANATEMPPVSQFEYTVTKNAEGRFVVMNTPPYVP